MMSAKALRNIFFSSIVCLSLLSTTDAGAQFFMGHGHDQDRGAMKEKMEQRIQEIYTQLNLSDEQKRLLDENKSRHKAAKEVISKDLEAIMPQMGEELKKPEFDLNKITALQAEFKRLRDAMMDERFKAILEVRKILTHEQFVKFTDLMEQQRSAKTAP